MVESRVPLSGVVDDWEHWSCDRDRGKGDDEEAGEVHFDGSIVLVGIDEECCYEM